MSTGEVSPKVASLADKKAEQKLMEQRLEHLERTTGPSGAIPNAPKQMLLDATDVQKENPEARLRWVNVGNKEKAESRRAQGYEQVPAAEGGRQVGNLALFKLPRQEYERRVAAIDKMGKARLSAHKAEAEQMAENIARELRDKHGIDVPAERILYQE